MFTNFETDSADFKDEESRIKYLTMIVDAVTHLHSLDVQVNPMNVLAGLEPENTNILLQGLAKATIKAQSSMIDALLYELESDAAENEREDVDVVGGSVPLTSPQSEDSPKHVADAAGEPLSSLTSESSPATMIPPPQPCLGGQGAARSTSPTLVRMSAAVCA